MKIIDFGQSGCERVRRYMDSYISNELLVESNLEVLRHIEQCSECSKELETRMRIRGSVKDAVQRQELPAGLEQKIRTNIRESSPAMWPFGFSLNFCVSPPFLVRKSLLEMPNAMKATLSGNAGSG